MIRQGLTKPTRKAKFPGMNIKHDFHIASKTDKLCATCQNYVIILSEIHTIAAKKRKKCLKKLNKTLKIVKFFGWIRKVVNCCIY